MPEAFMTANADCPSHSRENSYHCDGSCAEPVKMRAETGRWYITMGHCGFNSAANNREGYATQSGALQAMCRYAAKGSSCGSLKATAISQINRRQRKANRFVNVTANDVAREMAKILGAR